MPGRLLVDGRFALISFFNLHQLETIGALFENAVNMLIISERTLRNGPALVLAQIELPLLWTAMRRILLYFDIWSIILFLSSRWHCKWPNQGLIARIILLFLGRRELRLEPTFKRLFNVLFAQFAVKRVLLEGRLDVGLLRLDWGFPLGVAYFCF